MGTFYSRTFFPQDDYNITIKNIYIQYYESKDGLGGNFPQNPKLENIVNFIDIQQTILHQILQE